MESEVILKVENVSKQYRLGVRGTGTISHDLNRWWHQLRGKEDPYLKVGDINKRDSKGNSEYVWALKGVNFEVKKGEVLGIIGKNGAGKSTLLKILSKVTGPTEGSIKSNGRIASLLEVGTGFHPEMTGRENIYLNGAILGMTKKEIASKIDEIIEFSGCQRFIDTPTKRYSSGMTVRLAFAVAAHLEPDILIVGEVLAVGDAEFQKKAIGKMKSISEEGGRTVLFVSHNMVAVEQLCSKVIILENGKVSFEGGVTEGISNYLTYNSEVNSVLLSKRKDRKGNQNFKINKISFNEGNDSIVQGKPLKIKLHYFNKLSVDNIKISITICKNFEEKIMNINNHSQGIFFSVEKGEGVISITIPKLYLISSEYTIDVWTSFNDVVLDYVVNATSFEVKPSDVFNTGKALNTSQHGIVFPDVCEWMNN